MIVVGVDGSAGAARALEFAANEAELRRGRLRVVSAWRAPVPAYAGSMIAPAIETESFATAVRETAQSQIDDALRAHAELSVELVLREGPPSVVLLDEAMRAELLVVGSRGRGGFAGLLLGSVSQQVAAHAACPVVVVPPAAADHGG
jgi:nucleotide-binding universal stress UspA family protein